MTRSEFLKGAAAGGLFAAVTGCASTRLAETDDVDLLQKEIDAVTPEDFFRYCADGKVRFDAIERLDRAFSKVLSELKTTVVTDRPAVWFLYNMGVVVKTRESAFAIDLRHPRAPEMAPHLDFAMVTHNHNDHFSKEFYQAIDGAKKTFISNFESNYVAHFARKNPGGYTRQVKTFRLKDVEVKTGYTDHNDYLVDFTTTYEIRVGDFRIFHSGDCSNVGKLNPATRPDLWILHPLCGMKVEDGVHKFAPKLTVIAHINEIGHKNGRWTWRQGLAEKAKAETAGGKAVMPLWGERIV